MNNNVFTTLLFLTIVFHKVCGDVDITTSTVEGNTVKVDVDDFSYQVSIHTSYDDKFICGGTIVDATQILTVAHGLFYNWGGVLPPIIISIKGGRNILTGNASFTFGARNVTFHPSFNKGTLEYDLALIEIDGEFPSNVWIRTATTGKFINDLTLYEDCYVIGWNQETYELRKLKVEVIECSLLYSNYLGNICVENQLENDTLCAISYGSSLVCGDILVGVLSEQANCNDMNPITVFENTKYAKNLLSSSVSVHNEVTKSFTLWSLVSAVFSLIFSLFFQ